MDISKAAGLPASDTKGKGGSFAEALGEESPVSAAPQLSFASFKSSQAVDLAAGLGSMSPDFMPAAGEGMLGAMGMAEGAADAMRRYEEEMNHLTGDKLNGLL